MKILNEYKGLIFDFDGTLFDSMHVWKNVGANYLLSLGYTPEEGIADKLRAMNMSEASKYFIDTYGIDKDEDTIMKDVFEMVRQDYIHNILPKEGMIEILDECQRLGIKMMIATVTGGELVGHALKRNGMEKYFIDTLSCSDLNMSKNEIHIFEKAAGILGLEKQDICVCEDSFYVAGMLSEKGWNVLAINDPHESKQEELKKASNHYINSWKELI